MKTILLITGTALLASVTPAFAQDVAVPADAPTFTGPRAEIFGGWDRVGTRTRYDDGIVVATDHSHKTGWTAGGLLGYDMPVGNRLVVGAFGSYAISTARECTDSGPVLGCLKAGREIEGGARIGTRLGDKTLIYAKGAYVNGQIKGAFSDGVNYVSGHANRDGWRAGAGVEYSLNRNAYIKAEYDYTRFSRFDAADLGIADTSLRYDRNQVLAGFGVRF